MKVWLSVPAAAFAAALLLSTGDAHAQGSAVAPTPGQGIDIVGVEQFFSAPSRLGHAWERAVQAVFDRMRTLVEAEPPPLVPVTPAKKRAPAWAAPAPVHREDPAVRYVVTFQPVTVEPVTQAVADTRGERATLLGMIVELPWNVP
jgi:hypothetical protein